MRYLVVVFCIFIAACTQIDGAEHAGVKFAIINDIHLKPEDEIIPGKQFGDYYQDSTMALFESGVRQVAQVAQDVDAVLVLGDLVDHKTPNKGTTFRKDLYERFFKIVKQFTSRMKSHLGDKPMIPLLGNNDMPFKFQVPTPSFKDDYYGRLYDILFKHYPANKFLCTPENEKTIKKGFYYYYDPVPGIRVLVLNTIFWMVENKITNDPVTGLAQMKWLRYQLYLAKKQNTKVLLLGHVPYDIDMGNKPHVNWHEEYYTVFDTLAYNFRKHIIGFIVGHAHIGYQEVKVNRDVPVPAAVNPFDNFIVSSLHKLEGINLLKAKFYAATIVTRSFSPYDGTDPAITIMQASSKGHIKKLAEYAFDISEAYNADADDYYGFWSYFGNSKASLGLKNYSPLELLKLHLRLIKDLPFLCRYLVYSCGFKFNRKNLKEAVKIYKSQRELTEEALKILEPCTTKEGYRKCTTRSYYD